MPKEIISATIETDTANAVRKYAEQEKRSFSQCVDILLSNSSEVKKIKEKPEQKRKQQ